MKLRDEYDWIVLGSHPGALLSAALAARLGKSTLVIDLEQEEKDSAGHWRLLQPEPNYFLGMTNQSRTAGLLAECLGWLEVSDAEREMFRPAMTGLEALTPDSAIALDSDISVFSEDFAREAGTTGIKGSEMAAAFKDLERECLGFWFELPRRLSQPNGKKRPMPRDPVRLSKLNSRLARSFPLRGVKWKRELEELSSGLRFGIVGEDSTAEALELLSLVALARTGFSFHGGPDAFRAFLRTVAARHGAEILDEGGCRGIFVERGRFEGILIGGREKRIAARWGALGCPLSFARGKLGLGRKGGADLLKIGDPAGWTFTLAITVRPEAVPQGMRERVIWKEAGAPALEIEIARPEDVGSRKESCLFLLVRTRLPLTDASLDPAFLRRVAARMFRQLTDILPFLEGHVLKVFPDFRQGTEEVAEVYGFGEAARIPARLRRSGGGGHRTDSGIGGLFLVNDESYPRLGTLGATVAALESVARMARQTGLPGPIPGSA